MKRKKYLVVFVCMVCSLGTTAQTWDEWFRQKRTQRRYLIQQIVKLQIYLGYMKRGYDVVKSGMNLISDIKSGDLNIHTIYFDHLKQVAPSVRQHHETLGILDMYIQMTNLYKTMSKRYGQADELTSRERNLCFGILISILDNAAEDVDQLTYLLTPGHLQMSDAERLMRINKMHTSMVDRYNSIFSIKNKEQLLQKQRQMELNDLEKVKNF